MELWSKSRTSRISSLERGSNAITGTDGDNVLDGGAGGDVLTGGLGDDTFVFRNGSGSDRITDFLSGAGGDVIDVSAFDFADYAALSATFQQTGADAVIALDSDDVVTLAGVNLQDLQQTHFLT